MKPLLFALIMSVVLFTGCTQGPQGQVEHSIETVSAECKSGGTPSGIATEGNSIIITEVFETPNPCYEVTGDVTVDDRNIDVKIRPVSIGEICVQCIGEVIGKITISNLESGTYTVEIETPGGKRNETIEVG